MDAVNGLGGERITTPDSDASPGDYRVRSQQLRISPSDDWHAVTQIAADAIHDIRMLFRDVRGELMASVESPNMLQAIYNPIANELDSLGAELHELFVQNLGMEPRHYQWSLSFLGLSSAPRLRNPQATGGPLDTITHPDIEMGDAAPIDALAVPQPPATTSAAAPPPRAPTPAPNSPAASEAADNTTRRRNKGKGKARADREPSPAPSAAQSMRKRQRADTIPRREEYGPPPAPHLPNPRTVELLMQRYPHATLEDILDLSDAYAGPSATYNNPPTPPPAAASTYAAIAARFTSPVSTVGARSPSRSASRTSSRVEAEIRRSRGKRRRVRGPPGASRRLYVRFANPPPAERRAGALAVVGAVNAALANHPNEQLRVRATSADWTNAGQLYIQFAGILPEGLAPTIHEVVVHQGWGGPANGPAAVTVERYAITSQLCFRAVPCRDDNGNLLDAQAVAQAAFEHSPEWQEVLPARRANFMPPRDGASTSTLVIEITDTSSRARQRALAGTTLPFADGVRTAQVLEDRRQVPQCPQCHRWNHFRGQCRANSTTCAQCGEAHDIRHHRALATCCRGSDAPECNHPARCINCGQAHRATSHECPYHIHRNDIAWHQAHPPASQRARARTAEPTLNNDNGTRPARGSQSVRFATRVELISANANDSPFVQSQSQPRASGSGSRGQGGQDKGNPGRRNGGRDPRNRDGDEETE